MVYHHAFMFTEVDNAIHRYGFLSSILLEKENGVANFV